ncbi:hypothetical protein Natoc_4363 (plasmid) [Natronococcus occultus SP4]|uniref:Uncharacterized protein n=1 Tax=Natronococcus occultus SP4 TaxID=694430 RepID=L0K6P8_9EURY|nr:hypothetical protein Natoc_4363 [Natronococcus occultus SP4]
MRIRSSICIDEKDILLEGDGEKLHIRKRQSNTQDE